MRALPIVASVLLLSLCACEETPPNTPANPPASTSSVAASASASANVPSTTAAPAATGKTYSVVASFKGEDKSGRDAVGEVVNQWRIAKGFKIEAKRPKWGANGENDVCVDLSELTEADRKKALDELKNAVAKDDKVTLSENAPCHEEKK